MLTSIDIYFFVIFVIAILGIIVSSILYFLNKEESFSARILAALIFCISLISLSVAAYYTNFFLYYPHFSRVVVFLSLCVAPLSYLYVRTVLEQQFRFRYTDGLLFLPAFLYTLTFVPYYLLPAEQKLVIIRKLINDRSLIGLEPEGMLPQGWGILLRLLYGFILTSAQFVMLYRWRKKIIYADHPFQQNIDTYKWLIYLSIVMSSAFFLLFFEYFFHLSRIFDLYLQITLTISGIIVFCSFYLFARPNILYGLRGWLQENKTDERLIDESGMMDTAPENESEKRRTSLSLEQERFFKEKIEKHFTANRPYLKKGYRIKDLSDETGIPTYMLSVFINQEYGKNFSEFVNDNRVDYLAVYLKENPDNFQFTFDALCKEAGFNSRSSFIAAVKRKTGVTPSEFYGKEVY
jgi:AraC-like DNA-binding protein